MSRNGDHVSSSQNGDHGPSSRNGDHVSSSRNGGDLILRAFQGEGPLFEAMLDERARELAAAPEGVSRAEDASWLQVLVMAGTAGRWALPLAAVARVELLPRPLPVPDLPAAFMGLALLAGCRCLLADLDALAADTATRPSVRPGHAVQLRHVPLALVVDRAEAIVLTPQLPPSGGLRRGLLADGTVLLDVERLAAKAKVGGNGR